MVSINQMRKLAFNLPEVTEEPHFEKTSFRVNKKIFATYDAKQNRACIKLSDVDQSVFCAVNKGWKHLTQILETVDFADQEATSVPDIEELFKSILTGGMFVGIEFCRRQDVQDDY